MPTKKNPALDPADQQRYEAALEERLDRELENKTRPAFRRMVAIEDFVTRTLRNTEANCDKEIPWPDAKEAEIEAAFGRRIPRLQAELYWLVDEHTLLECAGDRRAEKVGKRRHGKLEALQKACRMAGIPTN